MNRHLLLCTDLDRTLIPNGEVRESPDARYYFGKLAALPEVTLAYVTGRDAKLVHDAIAEYDLPLPDFVLGDVGSTIYACSGWHWHRWDVWEAHIAPDWQGYSGAKLAGLLQDLPALQLQEPEKQNSHKLSYYVHLQTNHVWLMDQVEQRLHEAGVRTSLVWSIDEAANIGLLDILPARANKRHAIEFLMEHQGFSRQETVFAGDSGNDLPVLISPIPSVLVGNAHEDIRREALLMAEGTGQIDALYCAQGGFLGMNGHYAAGILEGVDHFHPNLMADWKQT